MPRLGLRTRLRSRIPRFRLRDRLIDRVPAEVAEDVMLGRLAADPRWLPHANIHLAFSISQRLRALEDPAGGNRWLHHRWVRLFEQMWDDLGTVGRPREPFDYVCMGPGARNPFTFPLLVHLAGARRVALVEPDPIEEADPWQLLWGLQEIVLRLLSGNVRHPSLDASVERLSRFVDLEALFFGPADATLPIRSSVEVHSVGLEEAPIAPESVDLLSSRSVLEHVLNVEACFDKLAEIMRPGGVMHHDIDLTAHSLDDPFAFYYVDYGVGLNELRLSDYVSALSERGFRVSVLRSSRREDYRIDRARLAARFQGYPEAELLTADAVLVAEKQA